MPRLPSMFVSFFLSSSFKTTSLSLFALSPGSLLFFIERWFVCLSHSFTPFHLFDWSGTTHFYNKQQTKLPRVFTPCTFFPPSTCISTMSSLPSWAWLSCPMPLRSLVAHPSLALWNDDSSRMTAWAVAVEAMEAATVVVMAAMEVATAATVLAMVLETVLAMLVAPTMLAATVEMATPAATLVATLAVTSFSTPTSCRLVLSQMVRTLERMARLHLRRKKHSSPQRYQASTKPPQRSRQLYQLLLRQDFDQWLAG